MSRGENQRSHTKTRRLKENQISQPRITLIARIKRDQRVVTNHPSPPRSAGVFRPAKSPAATSDIEPGRAGQGTSNALSPSVFSVLSAAKDQRSHTKTRRLKENQISQLRITLIARIMRTAVYSRPLKHPRSNLRHQAGPSRPRNLRRPFPIRVLH